MPEGNFVKDSPEVAAIKAAEKQWKDGKFWTTQTFIASLVLLGIALIIPVGEAFVIMAMASWAMFAIHIGLDIRDKRRLRAFRKLVDAYYKKKSLPFYQDVLDKFGDEYHVHHNNNGSITLEKYKDVREAQKHNDKQENSNRQD